MTVSSFRWLFPLFAVALVSWSCQSTAETHSAPTPTETQSRMIQYLEIVTPDVDLKCETLASIHGVQFSAPIPELGGARTTSLPNGGRIGVRGPLRPDEAPVVRPYMLVSDIADAVSKAEAAGATIALPPMELPGQGTFAIYIEGGIEHGLWQD